MLIEVFILPLPYQFYIRIIIVLVYLGLYIKCLKICCNIQIILFSLFKFVIFVIFFFVKFEAQTFWYLRDGTMCMCQDESLIHGIRMIVQDDAALC